MNIICYFGYAKILESFTTQDLALGQLKQVYKV